MYVYFSVLCLFAFSSCLGKFPLWCSSVLIRLCKCCTWVGAGRLCVVVTFSRFGFNSRTNIHKKILIFGYWTLLLVLPSFFKNELVWVYWTWCLECIFGGLCRVLVIYIAPPSLNHLGEFRLFGRLVSWDWIRIFFLFFCPFLELLILYICFLIDNMVFTILDSWYIWRLYVPFISNYTLRVSTANGHHKMTKIRECLCCKCGGWRRQKLKRIEKGNQASLALDKWMVEYKGRT
jgi:hypothetical protein